MEPEAAIAEGFESAGCTGFLHAVDVRGGAEICVRADELR